MRARSSCSTCCSGCCGTSTATAHVNYVRNITDVDDKINDRAARDYPGLPLNEAIRKVTEQTEQQFHDDVDALGCLRPTVEPRATEHIARDARRSSSGWSQAASPMSPRTTCCSRRRR